MDPTLAFGTTLTWNGNAVAKLSNIGGVKITLDESQITTHDSANYFREFAPTLFDPGAVPIEGFLDPADTDGQIAMMTDFHARQSRTFIITLPSATGSTFTGTAWIKDLEIGDAPIDGMIPFKASLRITGKPTFATTYATGPAGIVITGSVSGALTPVPAYAAGTYEYIVDASAEASITITVTAPGASSITYSVDGGAATALTTGVASAAISTTADTTVVIVVTVSETGKADKTYTIRAFEDA